MGMDYMKNALMLALSLAAVTLPATNASAATTVSVNTGVTNNWSFSPTLVGGYLTAVIPTTVHPNWVGDNNNSGAGGAKWITQVSPGPTNVAPGDTYYQTVFQISNIAQLSQLALAGTFWADNSVVQIFLNNNVITGSGGTFNGSGTAFGTTTASFFREGANTLTFRVRNDGPAATQPNSNPAGLLVSGVFSAVPEPGTWMLMMLGLGAVGFSMRRRHKTQVRFQFA